VTEYIVKRGEQQKSYTEEQLKELIASNRLRPTDRVWREGWPGLKTPARVAYEFGIERIKPDTRSPDPAYLSNSDGSLNQSSVSTGFSVFITLAMIMVWVGLPATAYYLLTSSDRADTEARNANSVLRQNNQRANNLLYNEYTGQSYINPCSRQDVAGCYAQSLAEGLNNRPGCSSFKRIFLQYADPNYMSFSPEAKYRVVDQLADRVPEMCASQ
jgi:hypothetical protein